MPLTSKGSRILDAMSRQYGAKKGKSVFYASINSGKLREVEGKADGGLVDRLPEHYADIGGSLIEDRRDSDPTLRAMGLIALKNRASGKQARNRMASDMGSAEIVDMMVPRGYADGGTPYSGLLASSDFDPFQAAAARQRYAVKPPEGRGYGPASFVLDKYVPAAAQRLLSLPERAIGAAQTLQGEGAYDPAPALETAMLMVGAPGPPGRGALGSSINPRRLGRSEEAQSLRDAMVRYGRDNELLQQSWAKHGPEVDWGDYVMGPSWMKEVQNWNSRVPAHQKIDATSYPMGSQPEFEAHMLRQFPTKRADYPGKQRALEWFVENDPMMPQYADGGAMDTPYSGMMPKSQTPHSGFIPGPTGGRTDAVPMSVKQKSYVIPADVVSSLGEGNSEAGAKKLGSMFSGGPYGAKVPKIKGRAPKTTKVIRQKFQDGGIVDMEPPAEIAASSGEYVVDPEQVAALGGGDTTHGHDILDALVKQIRQQTIKTLKRLPGPKQS